MTGLQLLHVLFVIAAVTQQCDAVEITYSYSTDADLISTKQGELLGLGSGDIELFGGSIYQIAVGDVTNSVVTVYQQDYYFEEGGSSTTVWSEQAVLVADEGGVVTTNGMGYAIDAYDDILMASAPVSGNGGYGGVFVFHDNVNDQWTQIQNLQPLKKTAGANFGYDVALQSNGNFAIIGEPDNDYITTDAGAAYIFGAVDGNQRSQWTQLQELYPENGPATSYFGAQVEMFGKYAAVTSPASCEIYIFEEETPKPKPCPVSSKQTHTLHEIKRSMHEDSISMTAVKPIISGDRFLHWSLKQKLQAVDCSGSVDKDNMEIAFDEGRLIVTDKAFNTDAGKIFIYEVVYRSLASCEASQPKATSLLLAADEDSACKPPTIDCISEQFSLRTSITGAATQKLGSAVDLFGDIMVVSSQNNDDSGTVYVYQRTNAVTWGLIQTITNPNSPAVSQFGTYSVGISRYNEIMSTSLVGTITGATNLYTFDLDSSWNCIVIAMIDLFGDGWNGAKLKVSSTAGALDYYFPRNAYRRGQSENPTYVRYCPDVWDTSNPYTFIDIEIPHALDFPYHWEMKWMIYFENSLQWQVVGNHATKARVQFSRLLQTMHLTSVQHPYSPTNTCVENCETFFSTKAPTKSPPTKAKAVHSVRDRALNSLTSTSAAEDDGDERERAEIGLSNTVDSASTPSSASSTAPVPLPRRSLHLRTVAPSMTPAPTFVQEAITYAHPWITLQDSSDAGWFQVQDSGTQWFLSSSDGMELLGKGTLCNTSMEKVCKLPLLDASYPSKEDYVLRVTGDLDSHSNNFNYFFCGKTGVAPSHMDFTIDIYNEYLDGKCTGNNYFTLEHYLSATLDVDVILQGVLSLGGYAGITELSDIDYNILSDVLRHTIHGNADVEVLFHTYNYYHVKKLAFEMYIPTSVYDLDPRVHGSVNRTFANAMKYLQQSSARHSMGELIFNDAYNYAQSGLASTFKSLLTVEVSEIKFGSFISKQHVSSDEDSSSGGMNNPSSGSDGSGGSGDGSDPISFVTDGEEESPTLSKTFLTYANIKMGAGAFFALSVMIYLVTKNRAARSAEDPSSSLLDVSSSRLLVKKDRSKKKKKQRHDHETEELLADDVDESRQQRRAHHSEDADDYYMVPSSKSFTTDLEEGEGRKELRDKHKKSKSKKSKDTNRESKKKQISSQHD